MLMSKKIVQIFFAIFFMFITMHANAKPKTQKHSPANNRGDTVEHSKNECTPTKKYVWKHWKHKRAHDPSNATVWGGIGFVFFTDTLESYLQGATVDYQIGVSKSLYNRTPDSFVYWALIFDYAQSNQRLNADLHGGHYHAKFRFTNEQVLLGYEQNIATAAKPYVSLFFEAGGVFQQRVFTVPQSPSTFLASGFFGGSFNLGFNFRIVPHNHMNYLFRLGVDAQVGGQQYFTVHYNKQRLEI